MPKNEDLDEFIEDTSEKEIVANFMEMVKLKIIRFVENVVEN